MTIRVLYFVMVIRECDSCCGGGHVTVLDTVTLGQVGHKYWSHSKIKLVVYGFKVFEV